MISYFRMKKKEIELKLLVYGYLLEFLKDKEEIAHVVTALIKELAHTPEEELKDLFIEKVVSLAHEEELKKSKAPVNGSH